MIKKIGNTKFYNSSIAICKEDLEDYLTKKQIAKLTDDEMQSIIDDVLDSMSDMQFRYSLEAVCENL